MKFTILISRRGKILRKDVVEHGNVEAYDFHLFDDSDNNAIIPLTVYEPKTKVEKSPVAVYMHGGPSARTVPGHKNPQFCALAQLGYTIIAPNYRGSNIRLEFENLLEGNTDKFPFEDVQATLDYIKTREDLESKAVLTGISYGTYLNSIILDKLGDQLSGAFLHTGFYGNSSPSPFDHIKGIPPDLPIFLASGAKDFGNTGIEWVVKYMRALEDISDNFSACILEEGGHQLLSSANNKPSYNLDNIEELIKLNKVDLNAIAETTSKKYNAEEFMRYVGQLVEFFDKVSQSEVSKSAVKIGDGQKVIYPRGRDLVHKIRVDQEIKAREMAIIPLNLEASPLRDAPYTFSQAHMMISLGLDPESSLNLSVEALVKRFLSHYDDLKPSIRDAFFEQYSIDKGVWEKAIAVKSADDKQLNSLICSIMNKEIENKGSYVLYHGCDAKAGFLYDVYSALRRLMVVQAVSKDPQMNVSRLRALDDAFLKFRSADDLINKMRVEENKDGKSLFNYLPGYQEVGLSAQWCLFGSYKYWHNSTFFRYFLEGISTGGVSVEKILRNFFQAVGVTDEENLNQLMKYYSKFYKDHVDQKDGRLLQIFVPPEIIDEVAYVAETGGYPLELKMDDNSGSSHSPSKIISEAVRDPIAFEEKMKSNRANFKRQAVSSRKEFTEGKAGLNYMNSVEARLLMNPKYEFQILNYHSPAASKRDDIKQREYEKEFDKIVDEGLAAMLDVSPKLGPGLRRRHLPVVTLQDYVQKGMEEAVSSGVLKKVEGENEDINLGEQKEIEPTPKSSKATAKNKRVAYSLYDLLSAGKRKEAEEWIAKKPADIKTPVDPQGRSLLYQLLRENKFDAARNLLSLSDKDIKKSKLINAKDFKGYPMIYDLLTEGKYEAAAFLIQHGADLSLTVNGGSMINALISEDKFAAAKFLTGANMSEYTEDLELIKFLLNGDLDAAKKRAQGLLGSRKKVNQLPKIDSTLPKTDIIPLKPESLLSLEGLFRNDLKPKELQEVKQLLAKTNDLNKVNDLYVKAIKEGKIELAKLLKERGPPLLLRERKQQLMLDILSKETWTAEEQKVAEYIYQQGVSINELQADGDKILFSLINSKQWDKIKWLQERGLNIDARNRYNSPPLLSLIYQYEENPTSMKERLKESLTELIAMGIDVNNYVLDEKRKALTALSLAIDADCSDEIIEMLTKNGADFNLNISSSESAFYNFLNTMNMDLEENQTKAAKMVKLGPMLMPKMSDGRFYFDGLYQQNDVVNFLLSINQVNINPSMRFAARSKILLDLIKKPEQWEKLDLLASSSEKAQSNRIAGRNMPKHPRKCY